MEKKQKVSTKRNLMNWIPVAILVVALIFSIGSLTAPWWSVENPVSDQIRTNVTNNAFYYPSQTISANHIVPDPNSTLSVTVPFTDLGVNQTNTGELNSVFTIAYDVAVAGVVLIVVALALVATSILRKPLFTFSWILALIAALLMIIAPIYLAAQMPVVLVSLPSTIPAQVAVAPGVDMTGFWGSTQTWTWGAGLGWTLMFTAAFLLLAAVVLIRAIQRK
jgi:hypothetical protein